MVHERPTPISLKWLFAASQRAHRDPRLKPLLAFVAKTPGVHTFERWEELFRKSR